MGDETIAHKKCFACRVTKPLTDFYIGKSSGQASSYCKPCDNAGRKARYYGNPIPRLRPLKHNFCPLLFKFCGECGEVKPRSEFHSNRARKDKVSNYCKPCHNRRTVKWTQTASGREYQHRQSKKRVAKEGYRVERHSRKLRERYNMTLDEYAALVAEQDGVCAICGELPHTGSTLHVDHDHDTGKVRGLLCSRHNILLGMAGDSVGILQSAIQYLLKHQQKEAAA